MEFNLYSKPYNAIHQIPYSTSSKTKLAQIQPLKLDEESKMDTPFKSFDILILPPEYTKNKKKELIG